MKKADRPLSDIQIWALTGGHEAGGHGSSCLVACFGLKDQGFVAEPFTGVWQLTEKGAQHVAL